MTREEEIWNAIDTTFPIHHSDKGRNYEQSLMATGFEAGVKWADAHPKSPWISVEDKLPPEEKDGLSIKVLVVSTKNKIDFSRYDYDMKGWISPVLDIIFTHWFPIPEPPKDRR